LFRQRRIASKTSAAVLDGATNNDAEETSRAMVQRRRSTFAVLTLTLAFMASVATAQQPPIPQQPPAAGIGGMPKVPTVELTDDSAKNAVDAYLTLREKYGDKVPPADKAQGLQEGTAAMADINAVLSAKGFDSPEDWQKTITSVAMAQGFLKKGDAADMDKKIAELEANEQVPEAYKQQLVGMLKSMRPSENNLKVVKDLMADPTYGEKLAEIEK